MLQPRYSPDAGGEALGRPMNASLTRRRETACQSAALTAKALLLHSCFSQESKAAARPSMAGLKAEER